MLQMIREVSGSIHSGRSRFYIMQTEYLCCERDWFAALATEIGSNRSDFWLELFSFIWGILRFESNLIARNWESRCKLFVLLLVSVWAFLENIFGVFWAYCVKYECLRRISKQRNFWNGVLRDLHYLVFLLAIPSFLLEFQSELFKFHLNIILMKGGGR